MAASIVGLIDRSGAKSSLRRRNNRAPNRPRHQPAEAPVAPQTRRQGPKPAGRCAIKPSHPSLRHVNRSHVARIRGMETIQKHKAPPLLPPPLLYPTTRSQPGRRSTAAAWPAQRQLPEAAGGIRWCCSCGCLFARSSARRPRWLRMQREVPLPGAPTAQDRPRRRARLLSLLPEWVRDGADEELGESSRPTHESHAHTAAGEREECKQGVGWNPASCALHQITWPMADLD